MNAFSNLLVCGLLQVTLVATVGLIAAFLSGRWSRVSAARLSVTTLAAIIGLTILAFVPWSGWLDAVEVRTTGANAPDASAAQSVAMGSEQKTTATGLSAAEVFGVADFLLAGLEGLRNFGRTDIRSEGMRGTVEPTQDHAHVPSWPRALLWLFVAAIVLGLMRLFGGILGVRFMVRTSRPLQDLKLGAFTNVLRAELRCPVHIEFRECAELATAATVGWRRPVILISRDWKSWSEDQLRCVLAHEIAHVARGDFGATVAAQFGLVLHFYHPLVHWLVHRLRLEQELAADAMAAGVVGGSQLYLNAIGELALTQSKEHVSWPAHAFLPTRRTFLRRVEMLRDMKLFSDRAPLALRAGSMLAVLTVTLVAAGLRPPGVDPDTRLVAAMSVGRAGAVKDPAAPLQESATQETKYVPADALAVAQFRPADLIPQYHRAMVGSQGTISESERSFIEIMGKCRQGTAVMTATELRRPPQMAVMLAFEDRESRDAALKLLQPNTPFRKEKLVLTEIEVSGPLARYFADDTTVILGESDVVRGMVLAGPRSLSRMTQTDAWATATKASVAVAVDPAGIRTMIANAPPGGPIVGMLSPLWNQAISHTLSINLEDSADFKLVSVAQDDAGARVLESTAHAVIVILSGMAVNLESSLPTDQTQNVQALRSLLESQMVVRDGNRVVLTLNGDATTQTSTLFTLLRPAIINARQAAQRTQQMNNFKQIMLAMHNYHDVYKHFPPAVVIDPNSGVPRSWRVELLPYLDQAPLYDQYRKNEPWDSEANKKILQQMPPVFRHPSRPKESTTTFVSAAYGNGLVFRVDDRFGTRIRDITDGTSSTIAIVEASSDIPWTKPDDLLIDLKQEKLPSFGVVPDGWIAGFADGFVRFISNEIDPESLKGLLTPNGREIVNF